MRLIDADAYSAEMKDRQDAAWKWRNEAIAEEDEVKLARAEGAFTAFTEAKLTMDKHIINPWHRVEDGLPEMSEIVPGYVCSETLVLYDAESGYMDIGYVREKPDNNGVDWLWGKPFKNPTHWMPIEPPKEDNDG